MRKKTVNRQAIVLIAKEPLLRWARTHGLELTDGYQKVFLVDFDDDYTHDQAPSLIEAHAMAMFEQALDELLRSTVGWPELTRQNFVDWFEPHVACFVIDLSDEPLEIM
jgi:hypothetical protein